MLMSKMEIEVLKVRKYKVGYEVRTERVTMEGNPPLIMDSAYTPTGDYIGNSREAYFIVKMMGIKPEKADPSHNVCSIGFCDSNQKWYGWSHRAICGFAIGDKIFEDNFGDDKTLFIEHGSQPITNLDEARQSAITFANYVS